MNVPCPTHAGRRAHKNCSFCGKPFCRLCEVRMRGHLYCSTRCARDAGRNATWRRVHSALVTTVPARLAVLLVALAAAAPATLAWKAVADLDRLNAAPPFARPRRGVPRARLESVTRAESGLTVEGSAGSGNAVFLFEADRFVAAAPVTNGRFRFEGIRESGPFRVAAAPFSSDLAPAPVPIASPPAALPLSAASVAPTPERLAQASRAPRPLTASVPPHAAAASMAPTPERLALVSRAPRPPAAPLPPSLLRDRPPAAAALRPETLPRPARGFPAPDLTRGPADRRDVLVSFDAGSSDRGALEILNALRARGIRTTIFVTGEFIRRYPSLVRRIAEDGHEVGNHTDSHPHLTTYAGNGRQATRPGIDRAFLAGELSRPASLYRALTGRPMAPLWRAPFGEHNPEIRRWAAEEGYWHIGWTGGRSGLDGLDWVSDPRSRAYRPAGRLLARLVSHAENGGIVLLHLGSDRDEPVGSRIGVLFDGLIARGFRFARASEFLEREGFDATRLAAFRRPGIGQMP